MPLNFSDRTAWNHSQNALTQALESKRREQIPVIDLTVSNPTLCEFDYTKNPLFQNLNDTQNKIYQPNPQGLLAAREAVARYYADKNIEVSPGQIFLTSSTSEAYTYLFRLLGNVGDKILAPSPGYPLFDTLAELNDLSIQKYALCYEKTWRLDDQSLANFSEIRPKALIWVNPNNPTGNFASADEREILNHFSLQNSCPLIIDEVFLDFCWEGGAKAKSFAGNKKSLTFTLSGISKILGLPQMKLSWIVVSGPQEAAAEACRRLEVIADAHLSVGTPVQHALPGWLENRKVVISEILSRVQKNYFELLKITAPHAKVKVLNASGGWYAALKIDGIQDEKFGVRLLKEKNVLVHPGYLFDFDEEDVIVVSLLLPGEQFTRGICRVME